MEQSAPHSIGHQFEMQPPPSGHRVFVDIRRVPGSADFMQIEVRWIGDQDGKYRFDSVRHANASSYWDLKWSGGHETLDMHGATDADWAAQAFRSSKAIRNTSKTTVE
jgi:hypothetical protein